MIQTVRESDDNIPREISHNCEELPGRKVCRGVAFTLLSVEVLQAFERVGIGDIIGVFLESYPVASLCLGRFFSA